MKKKYLLLISTIILTFSTKAQGGLENILFADITDANKLTREYIRPASEAFIYGMSSSWYHTAKVHGILGFDISIGGNFSFSGNDKKNFDISALNLTNKITQSPTTSPTIFGESSTTNGFEITIPANSDQDINGGNHPELKKKFTMPNGIGDDLPLNGVPTPTIQASVGLPGKFEATLRFVPEIGGDEANAKLFGLGIKKEITNWFGPLDSTPLHISLMGAFTNMTVSHEIKNPDSNGVSVINGETELKLNSYTIQALASLNLPFINIYGGIGYINGSSTLNISGTYTLDYQGSGVTYTKKVIDPLNLDYNVGGITTTLGARISLGFFKLYTSYSFQEYSTANLGVAFSFR